MVAIEYVERERHMNSYHFGEVNMDLMSVRVDEKYPFPHLRL